MDVSSYRLRALIPAFFPQSILVQPDKVPMPHEEVPRVVNRLGLVDVRADEVIEPCFGTGRYRCGGASGFGLETLHGAYICFLVVIRQGIPVSILLSWKYLLQSLRNNHSTRTILCEP